MNCPICHEPADQHTDGVMPGEVWQDGMGIVPCREAYRSALRNNALIEYIINAAQAHGQDSDPDHEVGDLQTALRILWAAHTPGEQAALFKRLWTGGKAPVGPPFDGAQLWSVETDAVKAKWDEIG